MKIELGAYSKVASTEGMTRQIKVHTK